MLSSLIELEEFSGPDRNNDTAVSNIRVFQSAVNRIYMQLVPGKAF
jgi:hypothetical protein